MNAEFRRVKEIFLAAVEIPDAAERDAYVREACGQDEELRRQVDALLGKHAQAGSFLESPALGPVATVDEAGREQSGTVIGPYKLIEEIGEGGMGTVWMAQQTEPVKRLVAVKLIKAGMDSRQVIARFEAERQALALMDHPNIARVLDAGTTGAGRPYFVMDLVKGVPITRYCDEHHLTPRQRLELFIPVCQAVQHAHQKGIIHRDLKPSNVLVALYDGKPVPKVIDFGVAKAAGQALTDKTLVTGFGNIVGTLEYMSPEQAEVNQLDIDTRSDIYSLGVLLYELLTGSPPFTSKELEKAGMLEMLRVIREQEPSKPSTKLSTAEGLPTLAANRGTEPAKLTRLVRGELDWIVMKALEKDRSRRYETANGFAMDVQRYLADEPVLACPPSLGYRLRKFARRNKAGLAVAALVLFFLVLLGSGVGWAVRDRAARRAKAAGQVESILAEVDRLEAEQKWPEALAVARRAEAAVTGGEADAATTQSVCERLKDLELIDRLEQSRMQRATWVERNFDHDGAEREYARAFRDYGVDVDALPVEASIDRLKTRPGLAIPLAAALDDWVSARRAVSEKDAAGWRRLVTVARGIDSEPLRDRLRSTWGRPISDVRDDLGRLAESIDVRTQHPATLVTLARTLQRVKHADSALRLLRDAQYVFPGDFWLNFELSNALRKQRESEGSIRFCTAAAAIRPNSVAAHNNLGIALRDRKKLDEAIACFRKAIELDPKCAPPYSNLGLALWNQKKLPEAIDAHRKAIDLDPKLAGAHNNLGIALRGQKKLDGAVAAYRKAIELDPKYAGAYSNLGVALSEQKKLDEAIACHKKALDFDPNDAGFHHNLGLALYAQQKWPEAVAAYRKAIELDPNQTDAYISLGNILRDPLRKFDAAITCCQKAIELDSKNSHAHFNLGLALRGQKKLPEAVAAFRKAIKLNPNDANAHINLGRALRDQKKLDEAIDAFRKAIKLDPKSPSAHNSLGALLCDDLKEYGKAIECFRKALDLDPKDAIAYRNLGIALSRQKKLPEAIVAFRKAIELDPKHAHTHYTLGLALRAQNKLDEAIACYCKAVELDAKSAHYRDALGLALYEQKKLPEAIAAFRKAIDLDPKFAGAYSNLGLALWNQKKLPEAIVAFRKAIELDPKHAHTHYTLGLALRAQNKLDEAIACYCKAVELDAKSAHYRDALGLALYEQKKLPEAIAAFRKAIDLAPKFAGAYSNLGLALWNQKKLPEAIAAYRKAIELDPKCANAYSNLGALLCDDLKDYDQAIECFRKAIELDPKHTSARSNLGIALWNKCSALINSPDPKRRDPKRAIEAVQEAIESDPRSEMAWQLFGWVQYRTGNWQASIEALEKSCKLQEGGTGDAGQWIVMSLAHWRLSNEKELPEQERSRHEEEARRWFKLADKQIGSWWPVRPGHGTGQAIWDFREEARKLMAANVKKK